MNQILSALIYKKYRYVFRINYESKHKLCQTTFLPGTYAYLYNIYKLLKILSCGL